MKFVRRDMGGAADVSSGGGGRGMSREIVVLLTAALTLVTALYLAIGLAVDLMMPLVSFEREQRWFADVEPVALNISLSPEQEEQLQGADLVLDRLTALPDTPPMRFVLVLIPEADPNAFAFPGGTIGLTSGLLDLLEDEIALAFVIGHELGHFARRDHLRGLGRRIGQTVVWSLIFGRTGSELVGEHLTRFLNLQYSRGQEEQADAYSLRLVHEAYGTTEGTDRLFTWLDQHRDLPEWAAILTTHPDPGDRIDKLRALSRELEETSAAP